MHLEQLAQGNQPVGDTPETIRRRPASSVPVAISK
ncbi:MAG: hypothetical protein ACI9MB_004731, partial [Verrucomicrobiales bacterium]